MNVGIIPARLNSTRLPRKILAPINNKPMIVHVYEQAQKAHNLDDVIIAIDHPETAEALQSYDVKTIMTSNQHQSGTDRIAEVAQNLSAEIVINIQGDEPGLDPQIIDQLIELFANQNVNMATPITTDLTPADLMNENVVKALINQDQTAQAFRRASKPFESGGYYRHIGVYAFRKQALLQFTSLAQTVNEKMYRLEQLRAMDNGLPIHVIVTHYRGRGIDTQADLDSFIERINVA